jgi:Polyketide cyclase / dehydrase and lipid transport
MADQATEHLIIRTSPSHLWEVLVDFERYPMWARDLKEARVVATDDRGRPTQVAFRAAAMGRSTSYTLGYDHTGAPNRLEWRLVEGDIMRRLDGSYSLTAVEGDSERTDVVYRLTVELIVPLPGFVKRRAESRIVHTALRELRDHIEDGVEPDDGAREVADPQGAAGSSTS